MLMVFANGKRTLLSVYHLILVITQVTPIHYVERILLQNCFNDILLLFVVVTKLTLIRRSDV